MVEIRGKKNKKGQHETSNWKRRGERGKYGNRVCTALLPPSVRGGDEND